MASLVAAGGASFKSVETVSVANAIVIAARCPSNIRRNSHSSRPNERCLYTLRGCVPCAEEGTWRLPDLRRRRISRWYSRNRLRLVLRFETIEEGCPGVDEVSTNVFPPRWHSTETGQRGPKSPPTDCPCF